MRIGNVEYSNDGSIEIFGNTDGLPRTTGIIPSPDCNTPSEEARLSHHKKAIERLYLEGYWIESQRRIKNDAFDKPHQKTSLEVIYRPCMNEEEVLKVKSEIENILKLARAVVG